MNYSTPGFCILLYLLQFAQIMTTELVMLSNHLILCQPLLLLLSIFRSIRVFSNRSALCIRWPEYWNFSVSISISLSSEYSGLISFRIDWFELHAAQGTLNSPRQICFQGSSLLAFLKAHPLIKALQRPKVRKHASYWLSSDVSRNYLAG